MSDSVYANGEFEITDKVHLWLGAGIMVEYGIEDAKEVLESSLQKCKQNLEETKKELDVTKDKVTTTEVPVTSRYKIQLWVLG